MKGTLEIYVDRDDPFLIEGQINYLEEIISKISNSIEYGGTRHPIIKHTTDVGVIIIIISSAIKGMFLTANKENEK